MIILDGIEIAEKYQEWALLKGDEVIMLCDDEAEADTWASAGPEYQVASCTVYRTKYVIKEAAPR